MKMVKRNISGITKDTRLIVMMTKGKNFGKLGEI